MDPKTAIPKGTILLYEEISLDPDEYRGNLRFCFTRKGSFFHQNNTNSKATGNGHFDEGFSANPKIQLNAALTEELNDLIKNFSLSDVQDRYGEESMLMERWTFFRNNKEVKRVVIWDREIPETIQSLHGRLDQLILAQKAASEANKN